MIHADCRGRELAGERLRAALSGFDLAATGLKSDCGTMALFDVSGPFVDELDVERLLDVDFTTADLPLPRLRLANGTLPSPTAEASGIVDPPTQPGDAHSVDPFAAWRGLTTGTTLILNNVASRSVGPIIRFANDVSRVTSTRAQINAYVSERDASGFGRHWDDHDVLIIQCRGRKHWEVFEPASLSPVVGFVDPQAFGERVFSAVLEPGMGLFIPRGWGHQVSGFRDELSVHLTCGMRRMSGLDLLRGLVEADSRGRDRPVGDGGTLDLGGFVSLNRDRRAVEEVYGRWRSRSRGLREIGPIGLWKAVFDRLDGWAVHAPAVGGVVFADGPEVDSGSIGLAAAGSAFAVDRSWVPLLVELLAGRRLRLDEIRSRAPVSDVDACAQFVIELGRLGFVDLSRDGEP